MLEFSYYSPTEIVFGRNATQKLGEYCSKYGGTKALIIYGSERVVRSGLLKKAADSLEAAGIPWTSIGGVEPNPRLVLVRKGIALATEFGADFFIGIGGGSVIDTTKAVAHGTANPDLDIWDDIWLKKVPLTKTCPVASILTIAASGSESSDSAVITNHEVTPIMKVGINTPLNRPKFAIMDPELTMTLPAYQIGCGTADIMMHTLERYFTRVQGNELSDRFACALLKNVMKNGKAMMEDPTDYHAASEIMWSGSVSHNDLTGLGGLKNMEIHNLSYSLSSDFDLAHGAALTTLWEAWAMYVLPYDEKRFRDLGAEIFGFDPDLPGENTVFAIRDYFRDALHMPVCFSHNKFGVQSDEKIEEFVDRAMGGRDSFGSFMPLGRDDVRAIYKFANH